MTGNDHIDAGSAGDHGVDLVLGVDTVGQVFIGNGSAQAGVEGNDDEIRSFLLLDGLDPLLSLPADGQGGVIGVGEAHAGIVIGHVPTGAVGGDEAENGHLYVITCGVLQILNDIGSQDIAAVLIVEVGADGGQALQPLHIGFQIGIDIGHGIPGVVKLVVTGVGCIIADVLHGNGHGVGIGGQALGVLGDLQGGDGSALIGIAVIHQNYVVAIGLTQLCHSGGHVEHGVVHVGVVEDISVPGSAVHIRGGQDNELRLALGSERCRQHRQEQSQHAQESKTALHQMFHKHPPKESFTDIFYY